MNKKRHWCLGLIALLITLGLSQGLWFYSYLHHNLLNSKKWRSDKLALKFGVQGAFSFFYHRNTLAQEQLNLGAWSSYQRIFAQMPRIEAQQAPLQVQWKMHFPTSNYLMVLFSEDADTFEGILLKNHSEVFKKNWHFVANKSGEFIWKEALSEIPMDLQQFRQWRQAELSLNKTQASFSIDGKVLWTFAPRRLPSAPIGFHTGLAGYYFLDDVQIKQGETILFADDFSVPKFYWQALVIAALLVYFLSKKKQLQALWPHLASWSVINICLLLVLTLDWFYFSKLYPPEIHKLPGRYISSIETFSDALKRLELENPAQKWEQKFRLLLLGSSQTWGAGAMTRQDSFGEMLKSQVEHDFPCTYLIAAGVSGLNAEFLDENYQWFYKHFDPHQVLINLAYNDVGKTKFPLQMRSLIEQIRAPGKANVLLVLEPFDLTFTPNDGRSDRFDRYAELEELGREYSLPMVRPREYLIEKLEDGQVWWDSVHLTSFGQKLLFEKVYEKLKIELKKTLTCHSPTHFSLK